jgi:prolyl oligopeptidase
MHTHHRAAYAALAAALLLAPAAPAQNGTQPSPQQDPITYPAARRSDQTDDYFGTRVADPYRWLEDVDSPETRAWVEAQRQVTGAYLSALPEREPIRRRLTELYDYPKYGVPFREGGRTFWTQNTGLQNQSVLYVQDAPSAAPRVLLDPNRFSTDGTVALSTYRVSHDGRLIAYATSAAGSDWETVHVRDVATGRDLPDSLNWLKFTGLPWTHDNRGFFYSRYDAPTSGNLMTNENQYQKLYYHRLGTPQSADRLVAQDSAHPMGRFGAQVTEDGRYAVIYQSEGTDPRNRARVIDLGSPTMPRLDAPARPLFTEFDAAYDLVGNDGPVFYVLTDKDSPRKRIVAVDVRNPAPASWRTIVPQGRDAIEDAALVGNRFVVSSLKDAHSDVRLYTLAGQPAGTLTLPGIGSLGAVSGRRADRDFYYSFVSFLQPSSVFRYSLATGRTETVRAPRLSFDPGRYVTEQVFVTSKDGTKVPMFITHRRGMPLNGENPTLLYAYGGFNISMTPFFSPGAIVWMEMGGAYAVANLRGGSEYGEEWHAAGTHEHKQNVFDDFIAAAQYLESQHYTRPGKLAIQGGSNGGLLIGAVLNQRPELFGVAFPQVGVMDMLRFHRFTVGRGWISDYGSSETEAGFRTLYAYSPLHNIRPGTCYPPTLVTTADHDDRVVPGHSFKYAATLQAAQGCANPTLIRIETRAGHGAGKPTSKTIEEISDMWAFAAHHLGMAAPTH